MKPSLFHNCALRASQPVYLLIGTSTLALFQRFQFSSIVGEGEVPVGLSGYA